MSKRRVVGLAVLCLCLGAAVLVLLLRETPKTSVALALPLPSSGAPTNAQQTVAIKPTAKVAMPPRNPHQSASSAPGVKRWSGSAGWAFESPAVGGVGVEALLQDLSGRQLERSDSAKLALLVAALQVCWAERSAPGGVAVDPAARPDCAGLPDDAYRRADDMVAKLAQAGDDQAKLLYSTSQRFWVRDITNLMRSPEQFAEYKVTARRYLEELAERGNTAALVAIGAGAANPYWQEPDMVKSWAYLFAAARARADGAAQVQLNDRLQKMDSTEQARARSLAEQVFARCCINQ